MGPCFRRDDSASWAWDSNLRRDPDDVARAAALARRADVDLVDLEACATKALCERRIGPGRPDGQHATGPQRRVRRLQSGCAVKRIIGLAGQPLRPVVDV